MLFSANYVRLFFDTSDYPWFMNHRQIEAFRAVMETGSMSAAARKLGISQPNVSRFIAQLEKNSGLKLFDRGAGKISPTEDAVTFYREVERSFVGLRQLKQTASDIRTFGHGRLRIGTFPAFAHGLLPPVIRRFSDAHPAATLSIQIRNSNTVLMWAAAQQFDVGIVADIPDAGGVASELLTDFNGVCILPEGHRLAAHKVIKPADLQGERFVSLALDDPARQRIDTLFETVHVRRVVPIDTQLATTVCALVAEGLGVSIVSPVSAAAFRDRGIVIRKFSPPVTFRSKLIFPTDRPRSRLTMEFVRLLRAYCDEQMDEMRRLR
jgi:DNA-binding transcriptional LysR family regulator